MSKLLTELLKKDQLKWSKDAQNAFDTLKGTMTVLAMPNCTQPFTVKVGACGQGIGAMLSQNRRPIAYLSKAISPSNRDLSTYEKEFLVILMAVNKWKHYLSPRLFIIKTDHQEP